MSKKRILQIVIFIICGTLINCSVEDGEAYTINVGYFPDNGNPGEDEVDLCVYKYQSYGEILDYIGKVDYGMVKRNSFYQKKIVLEPEVVTIVVALRSSIYDPSVGYYFSIVNKDDFINNEIEGFWWRGYEDENKKIRYALSSKRSQNVTFNSEMEFDLSINPYYLLLIQDALGKSYNIEIERTEGNVKVELLKYYYNYNNSEAGDSLSSDEIYSSFIREDWQTQNMYIYIGSTSFDYNEKCNITITEY